MDRHEDRWLSNGQPAPHRCKLPGRRERRRHKCREGALWRCGLCKQVWTWTHYDGDWHWEPVSGKSQSGVSRSDA